MRAARAFAPHELAARAWYAHSPYPEERTIAARRFRELAHLTDAPDDDPLAGTCRHVADAEHVLQTIGELALDGYHARAISAVIVQDRLKRIPSEEMAKRYGALLAGLTAKLRGTRNYQADARDAEERARVERAARKGKR